MKSTFSQSDAAELLRYRKMIGAEKVKIFTDLKKKHSSHALTQDISVADYATAADFFDTDGVIITGKHTGEATDLGTEFFTYKIFFMRYSK